MEHHDNRELSDNSQKQRMDKYKSWDLIDKKRENRLALELMNTYKKYKKLGKQCKTQLRVDRQHLGRLKKPKLERELCQVVKSRTPSRMLC